MFTYRVRNGRYYPYTILINTEVCRVFVNKIKNTQKYALSAQDLIRNSEELMKQVFQHLKEAENTSYEAGHSLMRGEDQVAICHSRKPQTRLG